MNSDFNGMGIGTQRLYTDEDHYDPHPYATATHQQWLARQNSEQQMYRATHTLNLILGEVRCVRLVKYFREMADGDIYLELPIDDLPNECLPKDISFECLSRQAYKSWRGIIYGSFIKEPDGSLKAHSSYLKILENLYNRVRQVHTIIVDGEAYHFPVNNLVNKGNDLHRAQVTINNRVFPLKRGIYHGSGCWFLNGNGE